MCESECVQRHEDSYSAQKDRITDSMKRWLVCPIAEVLVESRQMDLKLVVEPDHEWIH